ncbi:hypothetical protein AVEN_168094-1 [Araneus ventricosus]|uniref:Uncharacterized protein n=1 Tax=Araneus ventricosus TaxID=182803 RepID=A0A4Y2J7R1_ARAVE|nr:hypothetical protein AVEN_168094-1 [Araneus ventricosus]
MSQKIWRINIESRRLKPRMTGVYLKFWPPHQMKTLGGGKAPAPSSNSTTTPSSAPAGIQLAHAQFPSSFLFPEHHSCCFNRYFPLDCEMSILNPFLLTSNDQAALSLLTNDRLAASSLIPPPFLPTFGRKKKRSP